MTMKVIIINNTKLNFNSKIENFFNLQFDDHYSKVDLAPFFFVLLLTSFLATSFINLIFLNHIF